MFRMYFFNNNAINNYYDENSGKAYYISSNKSEKIKKPINIGSSRCPQTVVKENNIIYPEVSVSAKFLGKRTIRIVCKDGKVLIDGKSVNSTELKKLGIKMVQNFTDVYNH